MMLIVDQKGQNNPKKSASNVERAITFCKVSTLTKLPVKVEHV